MLVMDLHMAIIAHLNWKSKLSDFLHGVEELSTSDVPDHTKCDFGKWLYGTGLEDLSSFSGINSLEAFHKEVHESINGLIALPKEKRRTDEGKRALEKFRGKCDQLVSLLQNMEVEAKKMDV